MAAKALRAHRGSSRDESFHETMVTGCEMEKTGTCNNGSRVWSGREQKLRPTGTWLLEAGDVRAQLQPWRAGMPPNRGRCEAKTWPMKRACDVLGPRNDRAFARPSDDKTRTDIVAEHSSCICASVCSASSLRTAQIALHTALLDLHLCAGSTPTCIVSQTIAPTTNKRKDSHSRAIYRFLFYVLRLLLSLYHACLLLIVPPQ
jgi:hypothetical protein